jgi:hypothetical protein
MDLQAAELAVLLESFGGEKIRPWREDYAVRVPPILVLKDENS